MTDPIKEAAVNELLEELVLANYIAPIQPDEVTAAMLANRLGVTQKVAGSILNEQVRVGKLTARDGRDKNNHQVVVYRKVN